MSSGLRLHWPRRLLLCIASRGRSHLLGKVDFLGHTCMSTNLSMNAALTWPRSTTDICEASGCACSVKQEYSIVNAKCCRRSHILWRYSFEGYIRRCIGILEILKALREHYGMALATNRLQRVQLHATHGVTVCCSSFIVVVVFHSLL